MEQQLKGDVLITCRSCRKRYPIRELRYDKTGSDLICKDCFSASRRPNDVLQDMKRIPPEKLEPTGPRVRDNADLLKYYCLTCRFKFSRRTDFHFENCPSCGKMGSIRKDVPLSTSQLLEDSGDFFR